MKKIIILISLILLFGCENTQKVEQKNVEKITSKEEVKKEVTVERKKEIIAFTGSIDFNLQNIEKNGFFKEAFSDLGDYVERDTSYFSVGKIALENGKFAELVLARSSIMSRIRLLYFVNFEGKYYYIPSISTEKNVGEIKKTILKENIIFDEEQYFLDILKDKYELKNEITFEKNQKKYVLELIGNTGIKFEEKYFQKIDLLKDNFYIEKKNNIYGDENYKKIENLSWEDFEKLPKNILDVFYTETEKYNYFQSNAIFYKMSDGTFALYNLKIPFGNKINNWETKYEFINTNGKTQVLENNYSYSETASCGVKKGTYMYVINGEYIFKGTSFVSDTTDANKITKEDRDKLQNYDEKVSFKESDLGVIGKMGNEEIYSFKDKNHKFLKAMYKYLYVPQLDMYGCFDNQLECSNTKILNFKEFVEDMPLFFYKDPFGRNIIFLSWDLSQPAACGAKPVIYLYPEEKTDIKVILDWDFKNLVSYPKYINSWQVESDEKSQIIDKNTGIKYNYLFWEDLLKYKVPDEGFVIEKGKLDTFFNEKLTHLGLNLKEINEFKKYWLPQMQRNNFYFINFLNTKQMDKIAPITINPRPDNILRVFMNFRGLDEFIAVKEQKLERFDRKGFYVVEWGGRKE